jgi:hypothetical protein
VRGGTIRAANHAGGGAVFTVELPLRHHDDRPTAPDETPLAVPPPRSPLLRSSLAAALFTPSACGIAPTGVVQAGDAATGIKPNTLLYFVVDGTLVAVPARALIRSMSRRPWPWCSLGRTSRNSSKD